MALGTQRMFGSAASSKLPPGAGLVADSSAFTYSVSSAVELSNTANFWNPACSHTDHNNEDSGEAVTPHGFHMYGESTDVKGRRVSTEYSDQTTIAQDSEQTVKSGYTSNANNFRTAYHTLNRQSSGATLSMKGRWRVDASDQKYTGYVNGHAFQTDAVALPTVTYSTETFYGAGNSGGSTAYYHEWINSQDSAGSPELTVHVFQTPRNKADPPNTPADYVFESTIVLSGYSYEPMSDCVQGLGVPANSKGCTFMFAVNSNTGKEELIVCNGYVITRFTNVFDYSGITISSDADVLQSAAVDTGDSQGIVSYFDSVTDKLDVKMFTVSCANTSTIAVTYSTKVFTVALTGEGKPRLGQGNMDGRLMLSSTNGSTTVYVRTLQSTGINNLSVSNSVSTTHTHTITDHTCMNRSKDAAGLDNILFLVCYAQSNSTLAVRAIKREIDSAS